MPPKGRGGGVNADDSRAPSRAANADATGTSEAKQKRAPIPKERPDTSTKRETKEKPDISTKRETKEKPETSTKRETKEKPETSTKRETKEKPDTSTKRETKEKPAKEEGGAAGAGRASKTNAPASKSESVPGVSDAKTDKKTTGSRSSPEIEDSHGEIRKRSAVRSYRVPATSKDEVCGRRPAPREPEMNSKPAAVLARAGPIKDSLAAPPGTVQSSGNRDEASLDKEIGDRLTKIRTATANNEVLETFLRALRKQLKTSGFLKSEEINAGSVAEKTKILSPDEYDVMFALDNVRAETIYYPKAGGTDAGRDFCGLRVVNKTGLDAITIKRDDGWFISPKLLKAHFKTFVIAAVAEANKHLESQRISITVDDERGCPAVKISVTSCSSQFVDFTIDLVPAVRLLEWPEPARAFLTTPTWIDKALLEKFSHPDSSGIHPLAVTKIHRTEVGKKKEECVLFRISFSSFERQIMLHADGKLNQGETRKTCRKNVYMLLKQDLNDFNRNNRKEESKILKSYYLKTIIFRLLEQRGVEEWIKRGSNIRERYLNALQELVVCLKACWLEHYFISDINLLQVQGRPVKLEQVKSLVKYFQMKIKQYTAEES